MLLSHALLATVFACCAASPVLSQAAVRPPCAYAEAPDYTDKATLHWQAAEGTTLSGQTKFDFDGDGRPEIMAVHARVERDKAVNPITGQRSDSLFCWFHTWLSIRDTVGRELYRDEWSIKFEDMPVLAATHGASDPRDYFARFGNLNGMLRAGLDTEPSAEARIDSEAVAWSLIIQHVARVDPAAVMRELRQLRVLHVFIYRGDWKEDLRVVAYVPSLHRGVAIQVGY